MLNIIVHLQILVELTENVTLYRIVTTNFYNTRERHNDQDFEGIELASLLSAERLSLSVLTTGALQIHAVVLYFLELLVCLFGIQIRIVFGIY